MAREQLKLNAVAGVTTLPHITRHTSCKRANKVFVGLSLTSIIKMNSFYYWLLLWFIVVNCDMCKSNKYSMTNKTVTVTITDNREIGVSFTNDTVNVQTAYTEINRDSLHEQINNNNSFISSNILEEVTVQNVTGECLAYCRLEATDFLNEYGLNCDIESDNRICFKSRCIKGCEQWSEALANFESCQEICISTQLQCLGLPCISACEMGQKLYWNWQKQLVEPIIKLEKPFITLLNDTDKLKLFWNIELPEYFFRNYQFNVHIQYQYGIDHIYESQPWNNLVNYKCNQSFVCELYDELIPFALHKLRFKLDLGEIANYVLYSPATDPFRTESRGIPLSKPLIEEAFALDHNHISITWKQGEFTCAPLKGYVLTLENGNSIHKETLPPDKLNFVFGNLLPSTNYTIKLSMLNSIGEGPSVETNVKTMDAILYKTVESIDFVVVAGEYSIKIKSFDPLADAQLVFESEHLIKDYAVYSYLGEQIFFIIDDMGEITRITWDKDKQRSVIPYLEKFTSFKPTKISVDWLNKRLFIGGQTPSEYWAIISTDFNGRAHSNISFNLPKPIEQLQVDPINGWLFWMENSSVVRTNLATNYSEPIVNKNVVHFYIDYQRYLVIYYNSSDSEFYESTYDGQYLRNLQLQLTTNIEHIGSFWYNAIHILATNGTHLVRKNYNSNEYDILSVRELEWCWSVLPITQKGQSSFIQIQPKQLKSIEKITALVTSNMAKITWDRPKLNIYQTEYAWQKWDYELEIMDVESNSAFNIRNIKTTYFNVEKLQPNNLYKFSVRIIFSGILGIWSKALITRTWPYGEYKFLLASMNGVYEMNETGEHVEQVGQMENVQDFVQLNTTIYYINDDNHLQCANIMNPEINCSFIATNAMSLAYEWRGSKMYWVDMLKNCVMRANLDGSHRELMPIFGAQQIAIDAYNGHIYYSTGVRLVRRSLGDTLDTDEYEYYHVSTYDDVIRGFALDIFSKRLFWIVRNGYGVIHSYRANSDITIDDLQYSILENDIKMGSLKFLHEIDSLMWLSLNYNTIILARKSNLTNEVHLKLSHLPSINCVNLRTGYLNSNDLTVVPDSVDGKSIHIIHVSTDEWIIKWQPINSSENYTIFYNILLQYYNSNDRINEIFKTNESHIKLDDSHSVHSNFSISITSFTYWSLGTTTRVHLQAPITIIDPPKRVRVYLQQLNDPTEESENISAIVRWDAPENNTSYTEITYKIYCWLGDKLHAEKVYNCSNEQFYETIIDGLHIGNLYTIQVQSFILGLSKGGKRSSVQVQINPDLHSKPGFLYTTSELIVEYDLDFNTYNTLLQTTSQVEHLTVISSEKRILWVNENVELFSFVAGLQPMKLARMRAEVLSLTVDWIQRIVYWAELDGYVVSIYELNLCHFEGKVMTPSKLFSLDEGKTIKDLTILPFSNIILWLEYDSKANKSSLIGRIMYNSTFITFKNSKFHKMFPASIRPGLETVSLIDDNGNTCTYDVQRRLYGMRNELIIANSKSLLEIDRDNSYIYLLRNESVYAFSAKKKYLKYQVNITDIKHIKAYNYQQYPDHKCLLPDRNILLKNIKVLNPQILALGENYVSVTLPFIHEILGCDIKVPGVKYILLITDNNKISNSHTTFGNYLNITDLKPFTNYTIRLTVSTYYQKKLKLEKFYSEMIIVRTNIGTPSVPRNFSAYPLNPSQIYVTWEKPEQINCEKVSYKLYWQERNSDYGAHKLITSLHFLLTNLEPAQEYVIWLEVFCEENKFNKTPSVIVKTFEAPTRLRLLKKTAYNLTLSWVASPNVTRTVLACQEVNGENEFSIDITRNSSIIIVPDLEPKTKYGFILEIFYGTHLDPYIWPELPNERFVYETLGDSPGRPGQPQVEQTIGDVFRIFWEAAVSHGERITEYSLEALQARISKRIRRSQSAYNDYMNNSVTSYPQTLWAEEPSPIEDKWIIVCNTTQLSCIIREIYIQRLLMFRVRARNDLYGWGPYSLDSERISEPFVSPEKRNSLVLAIITPAAIVSTFVLMLIIFRILHVRRQNAKKSLEKSRPSIWSNLSTLQHQQLIASRNRTFSTISHSTLYTGGPLSDADIALLPHINGSQIRILNFLGSGAFAEVYEGLIKYENCDEMEKVAIKSLRKGAGEFTELLQEAQLMSNFKHDNIVRLIGVCFDTESISIIMEHMEGGDLLGYLRSSRPNSKRPVASLKLLDLISMCIDVCKGCCYLEDMHFVHRDLACRNCLVSSNEPSKRVVKIGDFGLARDIYKNDYYRKEGEGLLPVRWMSPESLIDGIFTIQSDVWAFAVLCWEILTLGQQPYAAKNNYEVLNYVKDGGRLENPENCPNKLFSLLLDCWGELPEERPSFKICLNQLYEIKTELRRINLGFMGDNPDCTLYANQSGHSLSTFKMKPKFSSGLDQVIPKKALCCEENSNDNASLSEQLETFGQDGNIETISDNSQLIDINTEKNLSTRPYINEGISRL